MARQSGGLGNMPLTLFVIVAGIILYLYVRRANLGIDLAPHEQPAAGGPPVLPPVTSRSQLQPPVTIPFTVPIAGGQAPRVIEPAPSGNGGGSVLQ